MLRLLLHRRDFALVWTGGLISMMGDWVLWIALPIRVYELTGSALATGGLIASLVGPEIVLGSFAGVFVDRWDRRRTMVVANLLQAGALLPLLLVDGVGAIWVAYPVMAASAALFTFSGPAENAFLPRLVPESVLVQANALNSLNNSLARLIGPAVGGALYLVGGLATVTVVDAFTFVAAAALIAAVRTSGAPEPEEEGKDDTAHALVRMGREWADGLRTIRSSRIVSVILGVTAVTAIGEGIFAVMFLVWVKRVLDGGVPELGWLMSGQAVGGLLGAVLAGWFAKRLAPARLFGLALFVFGVLDLALFDYPLLFSGVWLGLALIVLVGIPSTASHASRQTMIQAEVGDRHRGRVFGALGTTAAALMLLSTLAAGAIGEAVGPIAMLNVQGGAYVVAGLAVLVLLNERGTARMGRPARVRAAPEPYGPGGPSST